MLTLLAFAMVATFMFLIMTKRLSALIALILVPIAFALIGGFAAGLGPMMLDGIRTLAPTGVMLMFAILYFAIMIDSGLFDPAVRKILRLVKGDPLKVSLGTAMLEGVVAPRPEIKDIAELVAEALIEQAEAPAKKPLRREAVAEVH